MRNFFNPVLGKFIVGIFISLLLTVVLLQWHPPKADDSYLLNPGAVKNTNTPDTTGALPQAGESANDNKNVLPCSVNNGKLQRS
jgi:hypothetical protein